MCDGRGLIAAGVDKAGQAAVPSPPSLPMSDGADYGSDSDITMRRNESINSQRKLQHIHNSRRLDGRRSSLPCAPRFPGHTAAAHAWA